MLHLFVYSYPTAASTEPNVWSLAGAGLNKPVTLFPKLNLHKYLHSFAYTNVKKQQPQNQKNQHFYITRISPREKWEGGHHFPLDSLIVRPSKPSLCKTNWCTPAQSWSIISVSYLQHWINHTIAYNVQCANKYKISNTCMQEGILCFMAQLRRSLTKTRGYIFTISQCMLYVW